MTIGYTQPTATTAEERINLGVHGAGFPHKSGLFLLPVLGGEAGKRCEGIDGPSAELACRGEATDSRLCPV